MLGWNRDDTGRLNRNTFDNPLEHILETLSQDLTSGEMADEDAGSHHGREGGSPVMTLRQYLHPTRTSQPSCMIIPENVGHFEIKPGVIQLLPKFHGLESENPYLHLKDFEEISITFRVPNVSEDVLKLTLFPFSLKDKAKTWLNSLRPRSLGTWHDMQREFLKKFFPTQRTNFLKRHISNFQQKEHETFYECWERFKELLLSCPHHGFETWRTISFFYEGLSPQLKQFVETMCNGLFLEKQPDEAWDYLDSLAETAQLWDTGDRVNKPLPKPTSTGHGGLYNLSTQDDLHAKMAALTRKVEKIELRRVEPVKTVELNSECCGICEMPGHTTTDCPTIPAFKEVLHDQANAMNAYQKPYNNPFAGTYNPGWKNHPNFRWRNDQPQQAYFPTPPSQSAYTPPPPQKFSLEETLQSFMQGQAKINEEIRNQLTKLTTALSSQEKGKLPAQPQPNPQVYGGNDAASSNSHAEQVKSIMTLRNGKVINRTVLEGTQVIPDSEPLKTNEKDKEETKAPTSTKKIECPFSVPFP